MVLHAALAAAILLTPISTLRAVQHQVDRAVSYTQEKPGEDYWRIATMYGDCEDIALRKRQELIERGWNPDDLKIVILNVRGQGHAVLLVVSENLILDVLEPDPTPWPDYQARWQATGQCIADDLTEGQILPTSARCKR